VWDTKVEKGGEGKKKWLSRRRGGSHFRVGRKKTGGADHRGKKKDQNAASAPGGAAPAPYAEEERETSFRELGL